MTELNTVPLQLYTFELLLKNGSVPKRAIELPKDGIAKHPQYKKAAEELQADIAQARKDGAVLIAASLDTATVRLFQELEIILFKKSVAKI